MGQPEPKPAIGPPLVPRERFVAEVRAACERRIGFAAGKVMWVERDWLRYPLLLERAREPRERRAFELKLAYESLRSTGIFPADLEFYRRWIACYIEHLARLDSIGVAAEAATPTVALLRSHGIGAARAIDMKDQQPDRSAPSAEARCYLPALHGRAVLLVCPFAEFLAERATKETFEAVWAKTGKRWFAPHSVEALEIGYGFAPETQARFGTSLDRLEHLQAELAERQFDVALIAVSGLGIPLASFVKSQGQVGLSLGGDLQILFGVLGDRWRNRESWRRRYFNDAWVELPKRYVPDANQTYENYW
jgi:hypothetical protein